MFFQVLFQLLSEVKEKFTFLILHLTTMYTFLMQQKLLDVTEGFTTKTAANFVLLNVSDQICSFRKDLLAFTTFKMILVHVLLELSRIAKINATLSALI